MSKFGGSQKPSICKYYREHGTQGVEGNYRELLLGTFNNNNKPASRAAAAEANTLAFQHYTHIIQVLTEVNKKNYFIVSLLSESII